MNENIDLTKILKDCPIGWPLWSSVYGDVEFIEIYRKPVLRTRENEWLGQVIHDCNHPVRFWTTNGIEHCVSSRGEMVKGVGECTLFPSKEQRDWSKFTAPWYNKPIEQKFQVGQYITDGRDSGQIIEVDCHCYKILDFTGNTNIIIPFTLQDNYHLWTIQDAKDGDVLALSWMEDENLFEKIVIFKKYHNEGVNGLYSMPCVEGYGNTFKNGKMLFTDEEVPYYSKTWTCNLQPATKEQRDRLFQKIKEAGYKWNVESKTLEEKFNPKTLKPFDRVIVRNNNVEWECAIFSHIKDYGSGYRYDCCYMIYRYCIPYNDETKHLIGTTEEAPEYYRYWEE